MCGEWAGHYRPATKLDPEEFPEFEIYDYKFISAKGLLEDVVTENDPDSFQWVRMVNPRSEDPRFESLEVTVDFEGKKLDIIYDRSTPFEAFKLSSRLLYIFELDDHVMKFETYFVNEI
jgi:hypothetical protein